jgi:hypothetical protein
MYPNPTKYFPMHFIQETSKMHKVTWSIRQILISYVQINIQKSLEMKMQNESQCPPKHLILASTGRSMAQGVIGPNRTANSIFLNKSIY